MSRIRRFNRKILGYDTDLMDDIDQDRNGGIVIPHGPIDSDEQDELIEKFEVNLIVKNRWYINTLSLSYLICAGMFLLLLTRKKNISPAPLALGLNSIICSFFSLRYQMVNDYKILDTLKFTIDNKKIDILNTMLLLLILWITVNDYHGKLLLAIFLQLPLLLFIVVLTVKSMINEADEELGRLRNLKYKYKDA
ncbi:putative membrane protein [Nakaseomyces bracarensis]|uniref:Membrane protein n=1 Tax=Nakaseomyces bracarensis TaxID=273131 RepID=A0ABR4NRX9_9SACH